MCRKFTILGHMPGGMDTPHPLPFGGSLPDSSFCTRTYASSVLIESISLFQAHSNLAGQGRGDGCVTDCSSSTEFQKGDVEYLLPEGGYQAIIPGMEFTCYGYITSWRALAVLDERFSILTHSIYFQVWRPVSETERTYRRVDDDYLLFSPSSEELNNLDTETLPESDIAFLTFEAKRGETDRRMYFQPGDIVGFFIPNFASSVAPLGITFRNASHTTPPDAAVDMYSYTSGQQLCDLSECGQNVTVYRSILPQISVNYGK